MEQVGDKCSIDIDLKILNSLEIKSFEQNLKVDEKELRNRGIGSLIKSQKEKVRWNKDKVLHKNSQGIHCEAADFKDDFFLVIKLY